MRDRNVPLKEVKISPGLVEALKQVLRPGEEIELELRRAVEVGLRQQIVVRRINRALETVRREMGDLPRRQRANLRSLQ